MNLASSRLCCLFSRFSPIAHKEQHLPTGTCAGTISRSPEPKSPRAKAPKSSVDDHRTHIHKYTHTHIRASIFPPSPLDQRRFSTSGRPIAIDITQRHLHTISLLLHLVLDSHLPLYLVFVLHPAGHRPLRHPSNLLLSYHPSTASPRWLLPSTLPLPTSVLSLYYRLDSSTVLTRSHKYNDKDHAGLADGTVLPHDNLPKFFAKNGFEGTDPKKTKKNGAGKGNWGNIGEEVVDEQFNLANARRRSNSSGYSNHLHDFKTKFEFNEPEPVFEESLHGPAAEEEDDNALTKTETSSSTSSSVDDKHRKSM
ncbi:hypothetical protein F4802DRAFT_52496 [Xylaria palmicola]|nr:hypothetical protein F4802DRAFT_52496 [Xylaria palmicola]